MSKLCDAPPGFDLVDQVRCCDPGQHLTVGGASSWSFCRHFKCVFEFSVMQEVKGREKLFAGKL